MLSLVYAYLCVICVISRITYVCIVTVVVTLCHAVVANIVFVTLSGCVVMFSVVMRLLLSTVFCLTVPTPPTPLFFVCVLVCYLFVFGLLFVSPPVSCCCVAASVLLLMCSMCGVLRYCWWYCVAFCFMIVVRMIVSQVMFV